MGTSHENSGSSTSKLRDGDNLVHLDGVKARQFLHSISRKPFVTLVVDGDTVRVYTRGITDEQASALMEEFLNREEST